jgi:hypothetical protein
MKARVMGECGKIRSLGGVWKVIMDETLRDDREFSAYNAIPITDTTP